MAPEYYFGRMWQCEDCDNVDQCDFPYAEFSRSEAADMCEGAVELSEEGWWVRLNARGYMDVTDWSGPFKNEKLAREAIVDAHDVHPDTGDEFDWEDDQIRVDIEDLPLTDRGFIDDSRIESWKANRRRGGNAPKPPVGGAYEIQPSGKKKTQRLIDFLAGPKWRR
jgi:hypothetical protein